MLANQGTELIVVMISGGLVLALPTATIWYIFTLRLFLKVREKRMQRHVLRAKKKKKIKKKKRND